MTRTFSLVATIGRYQLLFNNLAPVLLKHPVQPGLETGVDSGVLMDLRLCPLAMLLQSALKIHNQDFKIADLELLAKQVSYRPKSHRYKDSPYILDLIKQRRTLVGQEARNLGKDILRLRAAAKAAWLTELLDRGSQGNFGAIAYFKRRQSVLTIHNNYVARAGGVHKATQDLKHFYQLKYTPPDPPPYPEFALDLFLNKIGSFDHCEK